MSHAALLAEGGARGGAGAGEDFGCGGGGGDGDGGLPAVVEVFSNSEQGWFVALVVDCDDTGRVTVRFLNGRGERREKTAHREEPLLAFLGDHTGEASPPGIVAVPSSTRPGQYSYLDPQEKRKYATRELAWQAYLERVLLDDDGGGGADSLLGSVGGLGPGYLGGAGSAQLSSPGQASGGFAQQPRFLGAAAAAGASRSSGSGASPASAAPAVDFNLGRCSSMDSEQVPRVPHSWVPGDAFDGFGHPHAGGFEGGKPAHQRLPPNGLVFDTLTTTAAAAVHAAVAEAQLEEEGEEEVKADTGEASFYPQKAKKRPGEQALPGSWERPICRECGQEEGEAGGGRYGTDDHEGLFYCGRCWQAWDAKAKEDIMKPTWQQRKQQKEPASPTGGQEEGACASGPRRLCAECGEDEDKVPGGKYGEGDDADKFFCGRCWKVWEDRDHLKMVAFAPPSRRLRDPMDPMAYCPPPALGMLQDHGFGFPAWRGSEAGVGDTHRLDSGGDEEGPPAGNFFEQYRGGEGTDDLEGAWSPERQEPLRPGEQALPGSWERPVCVQCGNDEGEEGGGRYGHGDDAKKFFCGRCWKSWDEEAKRKMMMAYAPICRHEGPLAMDPMLHCPAPDPMAFFDDDDDGPEVYGFGDYLSDPEDDYEGIEGEEAEAGYGGAASSSSAAPAAAASSSSAPAARPLEPEEDDGEDSAESVD